MPMKEQQLKQEPAYVDGGEGAGLDEQKPVWFRAVVQEQRIRRWLGARRAMRFSNGAAHD